MAVDLGAVALKVTPDMTGFSKDVQKGVSASMRDVGKSMQKTGAIATAAVSAPILAGFNHAANAAGDLNESINAVNVVFGEASDKIHEFAQVAADEAGLSARQLNELVTPVGAALQNVGFSAEEAADASINLAERAADMASVFNVDVSEALGAIQAGLRGEADPLERFGVGLSAAAVDAHALELGLADTAAELDDNAKAQARLSLIMEQSERVAGDFANTSDSAANAQRVAAARAEDLAASFGQKLLPAKERALRIANDLLGRFNNLSPSMQTAAVATAAVAAAAGPLIVVLGTVVRSAGAVIGVAPKVVSGLGSVAGGFGRTAAAAGRGAASVARAGATMVASAARSAASVAVQVARQVAAWALLGARSLLHAAKVAAAWLIAMGPIGLVIAAVVGVVAVIIRNWETIKRVVTAGWDFVKRKTEEFRTALVGAVTRMVSRVVGFFTDLKDDAKQRVKDLVDFVVGFPGRIVRGMRGVGSALVQVGKDLIGGLLKGATSFIKEIPGKIVDAVKGVGSSITSALGKLNPFGDGPGRPPGGLHGGKALARVQRALMPGTYITSTYRTPEHNRRIGGSPTSYHLDRNNPAVDIGGSTAALDLLAARLRRMGGWREFLWRTAGHYDHIHVAHTGGSVTRAGIEPLRNDELLTKLQVGETVLPRDFAGSLNGAGDTIINNGFGVPELERMLNRRDRMKRVAVAR